MKSRFTKISAGGKKLKSSAETWAAVLDNTTCLMWDVGEYASINWADAKAHVKKLRTAGLKGWRLPSVQEHVAILDYSRANPAIDTKAFPNCKSEWYWTGTIDVAFPSDYAWLVYLHGGYVNRDDQTNHYNVRAVRAGQFSKIGPPQGGVMNAPSISGDAFAGKPAFRMPYFKYTGDAEVLMRVDVDMHAEVIIVGQPGGGTYEWVIVNLGKVDRHSDCGYGELSIALRDGLIAFHGAP